MLYNKPEMLSLVIDEANKAEIDPALAAAIVHAMSQFMPASMNHSPSDLIPGFDLTPEEANGQMATYGLFQFTGEQARQAGYKGPLLELLDPKLNVTLGLQLLKSSLAMAAGRSEVGIMIYLGRGRSLMVPNILTMINPYRELIAQRPEVA